MYMNKLLCILPSQFNPHGEALSVHISGEWIEFLLDISYILPKSQEMA